MIASKDTIVLFLFALLLLSQSAHPSTDKHYATESLIVTINVVTNPDNRKQILKEAKSLAQRYYEFGNADKYDHLKRLFSKSDGSQAFITSNLKKTDQMFAPLKAYSSMTVEPPILLWGDYYFPKFELVGDERENSIDFLFVKCERQCYLSFFNWAHSDKFMISNASVYFRALVEYQLGKLKLEDYARRDGEIPVKSCEHPPVGKKTNPVCLGLIIAEREKRSSEAIRKFYELIEKSKTQRTVTQENFKSLINVSEKSNFYFYNVYGMKKIEKGEKKLGEIPYLLQNDGKELVKKIESAVYVNPLGVASYQGIELVAYLMVSKGGETSVQYIPFNSSEGRFSMPRSSYNLATRLTATYSFAKKTQDVFKETITEAKSTTYKNNADSKQKEKRGEQSLRSKGKSRQSEAETQANETGNNGFIGISIGSFFAIALIILVFSSYMKRRK